jgi:hypothetical protein
MNRKPSKSPRSLRIRAMVALAMAVVGLSGLALAQTTPALADPTEILVAVGSDVTQDVYNQFALDATGNLVGSYNATNPVTGVAHEVITPFDGSSGMQCSFARPSGSSEGISDLVNNPSCVDIARASSQVTPNPVGAHVQIPFAIDGLAGSTGPMTCTPASLCPSFSVFTGSGTVTVTPVVTAITTADSFTLADLVTLYANCGTVTEGGITYNPATATAGQTQINLYVPQTGSSSRSFLAAVLGFNPTTPPFCVHDHLIAGPLASFTLPVEEHDGTAVATDANGYGAFSIPQWISQRNGHVADRRHSAILRNLAGVSPFSNANPATGTMNGMFPIIREIFSDVSWTRVNTMTDPLFSLLNGTNSFICTEQPTILSFGFALIPICGQVTTAGRF